APAVRGPRPGPGSLPGAAAHRLARPPRSAGTRRPRAAQPTATAIRYARRLHRSPASPPVAGVGEATADHFDAEPVYLLPPHRRRFPLTGPGTNQGSGRHLAGPVLADEVQPALHGGRHYLHLPGDLLVGVALQFEQGDAAQLG